MAGLFDYVNDNSLLGLLRARYAQELDENPDLVQELYRRTAAENPEYPQQFMESVFNRAASRGKSLAQTVNDRKYYPSESLRGRDPAQHSAAFDEAVQGVLGGSNIIKGGTGNASLDVGFGYGRGAADPYTYKTGNDERYGVENHPEDIAFARQVASEVHPDAGPGAAAPLGGADPTEGGRPAGEPIYPTDAMGQAPARGGVNPVLRAPAYVPPSAGGGAGGDIDPRLSPPIAQGGAMGGIGGLLGRLGNSLEDPLVQFGLALASGSTPGKGIENAVQNTQFRQALDVKRQNRLVDDAYKLRLLQLREHEAFRKDKTPSELATDRLKAAKDLGMDIDDPAVKAWAVSGAGGVKHEKMSVDDHKAIRAAEDDYNVLQSTVDALTRAKELNTQAFTGVTAGLRGRIGTSGIPGATSLVDEKGAKATREWDQLMKLEAIQNMSKTLKGATTERELQAFVDVIADPTTPVDIRGRTIDRLLGYAARQQGINERRYNQLREGGYYKPGGGDSGTGTTVIDGVTIRRKK